MWGGEGQEAEGLPGRIGLDVGLRSLRPRNALQLSRGMERGPTGSPQPCPETMPERHIENIAISAGPAGHTPTLSAAQRLARQSRKPGEVSDWMRVGT